MFDVSVNLLIKGFMFDMTGVTGYSKKELLIPGVSGKIKSQVQTQVSIQSRKGLQNLLYKLIRKLC